ncbi:NETWORKED 4B [Olea europaea subsp. europaea]|uniref:NETWORKED 4B n=1 Tax=Olea europaea subsp. europaea TaxID=158383 RepID=A0A8S0PSJ6_OLEEU|nr:NETWORKED 4B [Olea europaea subsp. europaea]
MESEEMKSDSLWWYSHTSPEISKLVAEDVKVVDESVEEMLQLIGHSGDYSMEKVDSYHLKQDELIAHVKEFSRRYHLLAERYSGLTGELHRYVESGTKMENSILTTDKKLGMQEFERGDFTCNSVSSGRDTSDLSLNDGSRFIMLSSDSDSESYNSSPNAHLSPLPTRKMQEHVILNLETEFSGMEGVVDPTKHDHAIDTQKVDSGRYKEMLKNISTYEEQLRISSQKLRFQEEEITRMRNEQKTNESLLVKLASMETQLESAKNEIKMHVVHIQTENRKVSQLQMHIAVLEAEIESEKSQVLDLQESIIKYNADVAERDYEIRKLSAALQDASENFASEKAQLESHISNLSERLTTQEARTEEWKLQCESLVNEIKQHEGNKNEMKRMHEAQEVCWQDEIESMALELYEKNECVNTMNKDLDRLKLEYDTLRAEKDELNAKLQTLSAELSSRETQVLETECRLHQLHSVNVQLSAGFENANKITDELRSKVEELGKEVEWQRVLISDSAEEKREAIRQLCFALEHYRNLNEEVRGAYKRPAVMVS